MTFDLSFLNRWVRKENPSDSRSKDLSRLEAAIEEMSALVAQVTKGQYQLRALVENQAETLEETAENITSALNRNRNLEDEQAKGEVEEKTLVSLLKEFLPVLDGLERIMLFTSKNQEMAQLSFGPALIEALRALADRSRQALGAMGVSRIPATGQIFDPYLHHAVKTVTVGDPQMAGRILDEVVSGYAVGDKIIRYASVVVGIKEEN